MKESRRKKKKKKPVKWTFDGGNVSGKDDAAVKCDTPRVLAASASPEVFLHAQRWLKYLTQSFQVFITASFAQRRWLVVSRSLQDPAATTLF